MRIAWSFSIENEMICSGIKEMVIKLVPIIERTPKGDEENKNKISPSSIRIPHILTENNSKKDFRGWAYGKENGIT